MHKRIIPIRFPLIDTMPQDEKITKESSEKLIAGQTEANNDRMGKSESQKDQESYPSWGL